jgi:hypothetical protein
MAIAELFTVATNMGSIGKWIEEHPYATGGIVFGGGLVLLWAFGYLGGGSSSSANSGTSNLAAAYYAAEAAQTTAGTQLQMATVQSNAAQGIATTQANAAVAINQAQSDMATTLGQKNANASVWINQENSDNALLATQSNNNSALATVQTNAAYNFATAQNNSQASILSTYLNTIVPQELALTGGAAGAVLPMGIGGVGIQSGNTTPAEAAMQGFSPSQIAQMFRLGA